ncbi:MAG: hypothetical protein EBZ77_11580 [Chitinophagia bacterium]|nr:hypothetical protein [Chitinophagia bacterium]
MDNLVQELVSRAGLTEQQATEAIAVMKDFFMSKIPPAFAPMVEQFFQNTGNSGAPDINSMMDKFGL